MTINFEEYKNDTARKNGARLICNEKIAELFKELFGEDKVIMLPCAIETEKGVDFPSGTVIACVGTTKNKDGFDVDVVVEINARVKSWNDTGTKRLIKSTNFDDVLDAVEIATNPKKKAKE